jgi:hypothetical protein
MHDPGPTLVGVSGTAVGAGTVVGASHTDHTAAILAFVGALLVAALTAYTTDRRQDRQVAAERERLREQLRHDRVLTDRSDLRSACDEALDAVDEAQQGLMRVVSLHPTGGETPAELEPVLSALTRMGSAQNRLVVRLGQGHPVVDGYTALQQYINELTERARAHDRAEFDNALRAYHPTYSAFVKEVVHRVGAELDEEGAAA